MQPLTDEQQKLVTDYLRQWKPVAVVKALYPGLWDSVVASRLSEQDVEEAAWLGIIEAARRFDAGRGVGFSTYAPYWILSRVSRIVTDANRQKRSGRPVSGDRRVGNGKMWDVLGVKDETDPQDDPEEFDRLAELRRVVADQLRFLPARHRQVLEFRHGFDGFGSRTLREVGQLLGISKERTRQLEEEALARVARPLREKCGGHLKLGRAKYSAQRLITAERGSSS